MREIEFYGVYVLNETEQLLIFITTFDRKDYGLDLILNTALSPEVQDLQIAKTVNKLQSMTRKDAM